MLPFLRGNFPIFPNDTIHRIPVEKADKQKKALGVYFKRESEGTRD